jgi:hypothetical protein
MTKFRQTCRVRLLTIFTALVLLVLHPGAASGGPGAVSEAQVRAAVLLNLAKFVVWPRASGPLVIGVAGDEAVAAALLRQVSNRTIAGRTLTVRTITAAGGPSGCDVLYIGYMDPYEASELLTGVRGSVLTVGLTMRFLRDGGMIRIFVEADRMRFQVNQRRASDAGLQISSQLLSLSAP